MATIPKNSRNQVIRKTIEKYEEEDLEILEYETRDLVRHLENAYEEEGALTHNVAKFLDEIKATLKKSIENTVLSAKNSEIISCQGHSGDGHSTVLDTYESQQKKVEESIEKSIEEVKPMLRMLENKLLKEPKDVLNASEKAMTDFKEKIIDEYRTSSKKMIAKVEKAVAEYVENLNKKGKETDR